MKTNETCPAAELLSVIILTYNNPYAMSLILKAFSLQDFPKEKHELIIVDDGSETSLDRLIDRYASSLNIRCFRIEHTGNRGHNRNFGIARSRGERLLLIDGDMVPGRNVLAEFEASTRSDKKQIVLGTRVQLLEHNRRYLQKTSLDKDSILLSSLPGYLDERVAVDYYQRLSGSAIKGQWQLFHSHSVCLWKETYTAVGGFDPHWETRWGIEDIDLGYRLYKLGCTISINKDIVFYHLYHGEDIISRCKQQRENLDLLVKKYMHWEIELYAADTDFTFNKYTKIHEAIIKDRYRIANPPPDAALPAASSGLPENSVLFGIAHEELLSAPAVVYAFIPGNPASTSPKIVNIFGLHTVFGNRQFAKALVSGRYRKIHYGLFRLIYEEACRIARDVEIVEEAPAEDRPGTVCHHEAHHILFSFMCNNVDAKQYNYFQLACALQKRDVHVGINVPDVRGSGNHFLPLLSFFKTAAGRLNQFLLHELNILKYTMPTIMDYVLYYRSIIPYYHAASVLVLWEDFAYYNEQELFRVNHKEHYRYFLYQKTQDNYTADSPRQHFFLPVGIDREKVQQYSEIAKNREDVFRFLAIDFLGDAWANLDMLLEAFREAFGGNPQVEIVVITGKKYFSVGSSLYYNPGLNALTGSAENSNQILYRTHISLLQEKYRQYSNILFKPEMLHDGIALKLTASADCVVNVNSRLTVSPFVLYSIAFGRKPVILYNNRYEDYFDASLCYPVKAVSVSALLFCGLYDILSRGEEQMMQHRLVDLPVKESLVQKLQEAYTDREPVPAAEADAFVEKFCWDNITDQLLKYLWG